MRLFFIQRVLSGVGAGKHKKGLSSYCVPTCDKCRKKYEDVIYLCAGIKNITRIAGGKIKRTVELLAFILLVVQARTR